ncbi:MAG: hypothetical protein IPM84_20010 [Anaerolineae bacterium]|nr:hypothetical protein [Anaerolineae bacterium]
MAPRWRANAQVIQQALERNDIERTAEIEIKRRDTDTALRLNLDRELAWRPPPSHARCGQARAVEKAQAEPARVRGTQKSEAARG